MTKLNIRKNIAAALINTAHAVDNLKVPDTKVIGTKLHDIRCRTAAFVMPNDMAFIITPKENV